MMGLEIDLTIKGVEKHPWNIPKIIEFLEKLEENLEWEKKANEATRATGLKHGYYECPECGKTQVARHKTEKPFECEFCDFKIKEQK